MYENVKRSLKLKKVTPMLKEMDKCIKDRLPLGRSANCQGEIKESYASCQEEMKSQVADFIDVARSLRSNFNI